MGATEYLARFACELEFEKIPAEAVDWAKTAILDCTGVALAGAGEEIGNIITEYAKEVGGTPESGVIAGGFKTDAVTAALANGTLSHALDYDDYVLPNWTGHPTAPVLPAIFSLGQRQKISGKQALVAYIAGFEVGAKIGEGLGRGHYEHAGWHATATLGTMGAAAACCSILKLDLARASKAMGIAGSEAGGLRQNFGTMTKPFHAGLAARNGVLAARLAQKGFTADVNIIEGPLGFSKIFTAGGEYDLELMSQGLGESFWIVKSGVSIKPYPCCAEGHRCLDAILFLADKHDIKAEDVESVECRTSDIVPQVMIRHNPQTGSEGKFSMEFCMAVALLDRAAGLPQFTTERVQDPKVQELLTRVHYVHPPEISGYLKMESNPETVTVRLRNGDAFSREVLESKGKPGNRLSQKELEEKYTACASRSISPQRIERSLELLHDFEKLEDISQLMDVVCE
ncbi:MAG: MmgE/PrpD family protein [Desulfarculaceae bacterium]|jgi:2-methylcitrate dehydratase PrpD